MTGTPSISIIIPVRDDLAPLESLLRQIDAWPDAPAEVICIDGGADPDCAKLCAGYGCIHVSTRPGRGHQLHAGALRAQGEVAWFLHADASPAAESLQAIRETIDSGAIGGYFTFCFTGTPTWYKTTLAWLINLRCRFGIPYGDQGLFIRHTTYVETGGFADEPIFEEVPLVRAARRIGRFTRVPVPIGVSSRRWERDGWLKRTVQNRVLALGHRLGMAPRALARRYYATGNTS
jgi:rSAM/selenodomain-associated transferase 2